MANDELGYLELPTRSAINYQTVSNSETTIFMTCEYKHYFMFGLGLQEKNHSEALYHGILGHKVLAAYYDALRDGASFQEAKHKSMEVYHADKGTPHLLKMQNMKRMLEYMDYYQSDVDDYKVVAVEEKQEVALENSIYGFTLDLLLQDRRDRFILWDHKFVGRYWDDDAPTFEPQLPKYVYALRQKGINVHRAEYNFIKYVDAANGDIFRRVPVVLHDKKTENIIRDHILIAERIIQRRKLTVKEMKRQSTRNMNKDICRYCPFKLPCTMELEGRDISRVLATAYEPGDYTYQR